MVVVRHAGDTVAKHFSGIHFVVGEDTQRIQQYPPHSFTNRLSDIKDALRYLASVNFKLKGFLSSKKYRSS